MNNVLSTSVIIFRNIKDFKFENKLTVENKQQIVGMLSSALKGKMSLLNISEADANVVKHLKNSNLLMQNTQNLFVCKNEDVSINLFNGEHISIVSSCTGFDKKIISKAVELNQVLSSKISFAFSDEYGYLMSDLNKIGCGLMLESVIMLSAITKINKIEQVKQNVSKLGYILKETKYPAVYVLSTKCNLGISEKKICEDFENTLRKLQELEIESVKMVDATNHDEMLDKVSRSVAIINSAHMLTYEELYNILVNLRMGLNLGMVNIEFETLNKLQSLVTNKLNDIVSQSEMKELAQKTKEILKGDKNV